MQIEFFHNCHINIILDLFVAAKPFPFFPFFFPSSGPTDIGQIFNEILSKPLPFHGKFNTIPRLFHESIKVKILVTSLGTVLLI